MTLKLQADGAGRDGSAGGAGRSAANARAPQNNIMLANADRPVLAAFIFPPWSRLAGPADHAHFIPAAAKILPFRATGYAPHNRAEPGHADVAWPRIDEPPPTGASYLFTNL